MWRLLAGLGHPERALPPVVHAAGTNGKGSTLAFLRAMLEAAGYRVHVHTSPHLVRFNERIRLAGRLIDDEALAALLLECEAVNGGAPITFFEITTAAALLAFSRVPADVVLLETGLGGRLDATNVIAAPLLTIITPVSLDHQAYLGETVSEIAAEKAGILKPGVPCIVADQERGGARVIAARARELGAPLVREGEEWFVQSTPTGIAYREGHWRLDLPLPNLVGGHQIRNAGLAVAAAMRLKGLPVPEAALARGTASAEWPARLQRLVRGPLVEHLPPGFELWLDGAHNPAGAKVLAQQARKWRGVPLHLVFGMLAGRNPASFFKPLVGRVGRIATVAIPGEAASLPAEESAEAAGALLMDAHPAAGLAEAVRDLTTHAPGPARILVCGSLYLAGAVLRENG